MEVVDFNDAKSNCGSVWSSGDVVSANMEGDGVEREEMMFNLRTLNPRIHVLILWVNRSVGISCAMRDSAHT